MQKREKRNVSETNYQSVFRDILTELLILQPITFYSDDNGVTSKFVILLLNFPVSSNGNTRVRT